MAKARYDDNFYTEQESGSRMSASVVVPHVIDLVHPTSVLDIGCGVGTWLAEFLEQGVTDVLGVDGEYVDRDRLHIPRERFRSHDLEEPLELDRRFDLAISVEVAEHLYERSADQFVATLTAAAPIVLFSAAIPGQGGEHHVNCKWPPYWIEKFASQGYAAFDIIRPYVWDDDRVSWVYSQNCFLFARSDAAEAHRLSTIVTPPIRSLVHPLHLEAVLETNVSRYSTKDLVRALPSALSHAARLRLPRLGSVRNSVGPS